VASQLNTSTLLKRLARFQPHLNMQFSRFTSVAALVISVVANPAPVIIKRGGLVAGKNTAGLMTVTIAAECNAFGEFCIVDCPTSLT